MIVNKSLIIKETTQQRNKGTVKHLREPAMWVYMICTIMFVSLSQLQGKILAYIVVIELDGKLFSKAVQKNKRFLNFSGFVAKKVYP